MPDLINQLAYLAWANNDQDADELLTAHILERGPHMRSIIEGRRRYLHAMGVLEPLPQLEYDQLAWIAAHGTGYVHTAGAPYKAPARHSGRHA